MSNETSETRAKSDASDDIISGAAKTNSTCNSKSCYSVNNQISRQEVEKNPYPKWKCLTHDSGEQMLPINRQLVLDRVDTRAPSVATVAGDTERTKI